MDSATVFTWLQQYVAWREQPDSSNPHSHVGLSFNVPFLTCKLRLKTLDGTFAVSVIGGTGKNSGLFLQQSAGWLSASQWQDDQSSSQNIHTQMKERIRPLSYQWKVDENDAPIHHPEVFASQKLQLNHSLKLCWAKRRSDTSLCGSISWIQNQDILF